MICRSISLLSIHLLVSTLLAILTLNTVQGQTSSDFATVKGRIILQDSDDASFVSVVSKETNRGAFTDQEGKFTFTIPSGKHTLLIQFMGYETMEKIVEVKAGETVLLPDIYLKTSVTKIKEIVLTGKSELEEVKDQAYNVATVDAVKLHNTTLDLSSALDEVPGVRVRENGGVGSGFNFSLNGFTGRQVKFFIDGVPMDNFGSSFQINNIPINLAERIEVYKGVVPIWLGSDALGGAVNIVTNNRYTSYLDASYSYGSFNTHKSHLNVGYRSKKGFFAQIHGFQNYSDNNYWVTVDVADINTGQYFKNQRVRRFHDQYHNETLISKIGFVEKKFADKLLVGMTLGQNRAEIQSGARMVSVFGDWYRKGNIIMPSLEYQKKNLLIKGLDFSFNANYNLGQEQNVDTVYRRYNWLQQYKQYPGQGSERERSLYKFRNNTGLLIATLNYRINIRHSITVNNVVNSFNRKGSDELYPQNAKYDQPRKNLKNVLGVGYKYDFNEKWSSSVFVKYFYQQNTFSRVYTSNGKDTYIGNKNHFSKTGYGVATTYFLRKDLQVKASFEKSYRLPGTDELYGDLINLEGNIDLAPEMSYNYNLGMDYSWKIKTAHRVTLNGNILYRDARDFIRTRLNQNQTKQVNDNLADVTNLGFDGEIRYSFKNFFKAGFNLTYQNLRNNTKYEEGQNTVSIIYRDRIPNMPFLYGNGNASLQVRKLGKKKLNTLSFGYNVLYVHAYYLYWPSLGNEKLGIPMQLSHDVNIVYSLREGKYNIAAECRNLMNADLYDNFSLQKPGRAFYIKFRYFIVKK